MRSVQPLQVFEIGFEAIAPSTRHKSGISVRFPRILRWRQDKPPDQADSLATAQALMGPRSGGAGGRGGVGRWVVGEWGSGAGYGLV